VVLVLVLVEEEEVEAAADEDEIAGKVNLPNQDPAYDVPF
jgi:hypothetical protein